jgi:hypothetical protein
MFSTSARQQLKRFAAPKAIGSPSYRSGSNPKSLSRISGRRFLSGAEPQHIVSSNLLYLHVGPSGDCWTGHEIFAAKHLQPDYVKSVRLESGVCVDTLLELLEENDDWARHIYDNEAFPDDLLQRLKAIMK